MHFFNPVPVMQLVELIRGLQTSDDTYAATEAISKAVGKAPVQVKNSPGFVVNRLLCPMINEAVFALGEGLATPQQIDDAMRMGCNHPIGPLALCDLIGVDVRARRDAGAVRGLQGLEVPARAAAGGNGRGRLPRPQDRARVLHLRDRAPRRRRRRECRGDRRACSPPASRARLRRVAATADALADPSSTSASAFKIPAPTCCRTEPASPARYDGELRSGSGHAYSAGSMNYQQAVRVQPGACRDARIATELDRAAASTMESRSRRRRAFLEQGAIAASSPRGSR